MAASAWKEGGGVLFAAAVLYEGTGIAVEKCRSIPSAAQTEQKKHCRDAESSSAPKRGVFFSIYLHSRVCVSYPSLPLPTMDGWMDAGEKETASVHQRHRRSRASNFTRPFSHTVRGKKVCSNDDEKLSPPLVLWLVCLSSFPSLPLPLCGMLVLLGKTTLSSS